MPATLRGVIRDGRVEVDGPIEYPDGTEVEVAPKAFASDDFLAPPHEIARVLAAMNRLQPLDISPAESTELDAWERELNRRGIERSETGLEDVFK